MIPSRVYHYRDPAAVHLGLNELRRTGLTPRGLLFIALNPRGETHIAVPEDFDSVTTIRVGDKLSLEPPWEGRYYHFDAIHRLPAETVLWNGDRRLEDTGAAIEVAIAVAQWCKGMNAKDVILGCTPHQPGSWWALNQRTPVVDLKNQGLVDTVVTTSGLLARKTMDAKLYHLSWADLAKTGPGQGWREVFTSTMGNILMVERRVLNYRLVLTCEKGLIEVDVSGLPENVVHAAHVELDSGIGVVGRMTGGAFAVTRGKVEPWGLADISPATLVGGPNENLFDLGMHLAD